MKASDLRLGNIVGVCYENLSTPAEVIVLEPGVVHLSNRKYPDSDRDIVGIPLSENWIVMYSPSVSTEILMKGFGLVVSAYRIALEIRLLKIIFIRFLSEKNGDCPWIITSCLILSADSIYR